MSFEMTIKSTFASSDPNMSSRTPLAFWNLPPRDLLGQLGTTTSGLTHAEVRQQITQFGANRLTPKRPTDELALLLGQFNSPLILFLVFGAGLSFFLHDPLDAAIILSIVAAMGRSAL
jgi:Mg2+-importing ATPase